MNKFTILASIGLFMLGAVVGRWTVPHAAASAAPVAATETIVLAPTLLPPIEGPI